MRNRPLVTLVLPAYNEAMNLPMLYERITRVVESCDGYDFEMLLIDNCSRDQTSEIAKQFVQKDPRWRYIRFSRNFGFETSIAAGNFYARGDALINIPSDLQDPPELIPAFLEKWKAESVDVVYGVLNQRSDASFFKTLGARIAYLMIHYLSDIRIPINATDFRLITRPVIDALNRCQERNRYMRGLVHWVGFRSTSIPYDRAPRLQGESTAGIVYCINFAISAILAFSDKPLRWASVIGIFATALSIIGAVFYTTLHILAHFGFHPVPMAPRGWATIVLLILFFGGLQSLFLGILGEYMGRLFTEAKRRPLWVIQETKGFNAQQDPLSDEGRWFELSG